MLKVLSLLAALSALSFFGCANAAPPNCEEAAAKPSASAQSEAPKAPTEADPSLDFTRDGKPVRTLRLSEITARAKVETWSAIDPYYEKKKTFRAIPLGDVVRLGLGSEDPDLERLDFVLRAKDGYTVPLPGKKLFEQGGYLAIEDVEVAGWEPIGPQRANPGPFYVVWRNDDQQRLDTHPRPWQLASIGIAPFSATFPHTIPKGEAEGSPAMRGFSIFREQCILCHAVNREGGRTGPELNVPKSVVEYRPASQIREYIRDPRSFRYGLMPSHPHLRDADLDGLIAYFSVMKSQKFDPDAEKAAGH